MHRVFNTCQLTHHDDRPRPAYSYLYKNFYTKIYTLCAIKNLKRLKQGHCSSCMPSKLQEDGLFMLRIFSFYKLNYINKTLTIRCKKLMNFYSESVRLPLFLEDSITIYKYA